MFVSFPYVCLCVFVFFFVCLKCYCGLFVKYYVMPRDLVSCFFCACVRGCV